MYVGGRSSSGRRGGPGPGGAGRGSARCCRRPRATTVFRDAAAPEAAPEPGGAARTPRPAGPAPRPPPPACDGKSP
ncbi:hypothetical protein B7R87_25235 [Streptomyces tsukubensis]|nr:hypothetical protein B7R87_25235 [Streptomyces tsukubensis]